MNRQCVHPLFFLPARLAESLAADDCDGARLRALVTLLLAEAHPGARRQVIEMLVEHAVAMEINNAVVWRFEKAIALLRKNAGDAANRG